MDVESNQVVALLEDMGDIVDLETISQDVVKAAQQVQVSIQKISADAEMLIGLLGGVVVGDIIAYAELTQAIGRDIQDEGRGVLNTARNRLLRDERMVFETIREVGLRRSSDSDIVANTGTQTLRRMRSTVRRGKLYLDAIQDVEKLSQEELRYLNAQKGVLSIVKMVASSKKVKQLEQVVVPDPGQKFLTSLGLM